MPVPPVRRRLAPTLVLLLGGVAGCGVGSKPDNPPARPAASFTGQVVTLAAFPATPSSKPAAIEPVSAQKGEWEARTGGHVEVATDPAAAQVLVFRASDLGELVARKALAPFPEASLLPPPRPESDMDGPLSRSEADAEANEEDDPVALGDILPVFRDHLSRSGTDLMAVPVGGSALVLVYRRDAFDRPEWKDEAEKAGVALAPPRTYEQLDALAKFLHGRDLDGDGTPEAGIALALGDGDPEGIGQAIYLARAAAYGFHPDQFGYLFDDETIGPWVASPPFEAALADLKALAASGPDGVTTWGADAARAAFRDGRAALLIDRAERASSWVDAKKARPVGVVEMPGSSRVYDPIRKAWQDLDAPNRPMATVDGGGWLAGLSSSTTEAQRGAAIDFLVYLASKETAGRLAASRDVAMLPVRTSLLGVGLPDPRSSPGVDARAWTRAVAATLTADRPTPSLQVPEASAYLDELAAACRAVLDGRDTPRDALAKVAASWSARTEKLGRDRMIWHYRRGLNQATATPEPPAGTAPTAR
jgi:multiple sugar transport system substrate-binding protein